MFSEDAFSFRLSYSLYKGDEIEKGLWLVLAGINQIPPHIALVYEGKYFSISVNRVNIGISVKKFIDAVARLNMASLFISISVENQSAEQAGKNNFHSVLTDIFGRYGVLKNDENTCLSPVRDFFTEQFNPRFAKAKLVFELIKTGQEIGLLKQCKGIGIPGSNSKGNNIIEIPKYSLEEVKCVIKSH